MTLQKTFIFILIIRSQNYRGSKSKISFIEKCLVYTSEQQNNFYQHVWQSKHKSVILRHYLRNSLTLHFKTEFRFDCN